MGRVLVAYDFTPTAVGALHWASGYARETGREVTLVHVALIAPPAVAPEVIVPIDAPTPADLAALEARIREASTAAGLPATTPIEVMAGAHIGAALVARADECRAELIVVGTHGRAPLVRALLGSTADYIVRHAHCPVLTVREHGA